MNAAASQFRKGTWYFCDTSQFRNENVKVPGTFTVALDGCKIPLL